MRQGNTLTIIQQVMGELGLGVPSSITSIDTNVTQMVALLNACGTELSTYFPWQELVKEWQVPIVVGQEWVPLPTDYFYFVDRTQWDRTNHWPLLGPRTASEWQWLKGGLLSTGPRMRYRVYQNKFYMFPAPAAGQDLRMEYISANWANGTSGGVPVVSSDSDEPVFDMWLLGRFVKLKWMETKGLNTMAAATAFQNMFDSITGKDMGAPTINLSGKAASNLININNIPDGSWQVTP